MVILTKPTAKEQYEDKIDKLKSHYFDLNENSTILDAIDWDVRELEPNNAAIAYLQIRRK